MFYNAVGNLCAVNLKSLKLPISDDETLQILYRKGFKQISVDLVALARDRVGKAIYRRGAHPDEAPNVFDCSSFVKWLYSKRGIKLPRRSIQQSEKGRKIELDSLAPGDLVFVSGAIDYFRSDPKKGIGHVGIATGEGTIVHAANSKVHIIETQTDVFVGRERFRIARRYFSSNTITLSVPEHRHIETSDDIRWVVLQNL